MRIKFAALFVNMYRAEHAHASRFLDSLSAWKFVYYAIYIIDSA